MKADSASEFPPAAPRRVARRPPLPLLVLLIASMSMALLTAGHARDYIRSWSRVRAGKSILEQRLSMGRRQGWPTAIVPWFDRSFVAFAEQLKNTVPPDAKILVEPNPGAISDSSGRARWFMYLNYLAYPLRLYVRQPAWAGGTLVDYGKWLDHHRRAARRRYSLDEQIEIDDRGIDWKIVFAVTRDFSRKGTQLFQRNAGGGWDPVPLAGFDDEPPEPEAEPRAEGADGADPEADG